MQFPLHQPRSCDHALKLESTTENDELLIHSVTFCNNVPQVVWALVIDHRLVIDYSEVLMRIWVLDGVGLTFRATDTFHDPLWYDMRLRFNCQKIRNRQIRYRSRNQCRGQRLDMMEISSLANTRS